MATGTGTAGSAIELIRIKWVRYSGRICGRGGPGSVDNISASKPLLQDRTEQCKCPESPPQEAEVRSEPGGQGGTAPVQGSGRQVQTEVGTQLDLGRQTGRPH